MSTNYQMYVKQGYDSFRFPVLPEKVTISYGSNNEKLRVCGVGEVTIIQDRDAAVLKFESFFPKTYFSGCDYKDIPVPEVACSKIHAMMNSKKPVRYTITGGMGVSMYATIEDFKTWEEGGDVGTIYYSITFKEYKETLIRQIKVNVSAKKAKISGMSSRTDPTVAAQTYTVKKGDCLWNIAKKFYGSGAKYSIIYNANKGVIGGNTNLIYPGQILTIPGTDSSYDSGSGSSPSSGSGSSPTSGNKTNPPYAILSKSYGEIMTGFNSWTEAYNYYLLYGGLNKGWKIVDKNQNVVTP